MSAILARLWKREVRDIRVVGLVDQTARVGSEGIIDLHRRGVIACLAQKDHDFSVTRVFSTEGSGYLQVDETF